MLFIQLLMFLVYCERTYAGVLPDYYKSPETADTYDIPQIALPLAPIKHGSLAETHGKPVKPDCTENGGPENLPFAPIKKKPSPVPVSFHLPLLSYSGLYLINTETDHHSPPLKFDTSYSSPIKQPLLIEAAPSKDSKVVTDSFLMPPPRSAWSEKFQPLSPEPVGSKIITKPQPLSILREDRFENTQLYAPTLTAVQEPIYFHQPHTFYAASSPKFYY